jgi:hypothetical protein
MHAFAAALFLATGLSAQAQGMPGKSKAEEIDPFLPEPLRPTLEKAIDAELDPKRGVGNAVEILKVKKSELAGRRTDEVALELRSAAIKVRERFMTADEFTAEMRPVQALSTFSRLDLHDPGLGQWLDRALDKNPAAKKKLGKRGTWTIKVAILVRGSGLDKKLVHDAFASAFQKVGVRLETVAPREAPMVITVGAEDAPQEGSDGAGVKVTFAAQSLDHEKVSWEQSLYRIERAKSFEVALRSGLEWIARIGGRDLFFRWLGESAFPLLLDPSPHALAAPEPRRR